jgi:hypothetical protein
MLAYVHFAAANYLHDDAYPSKWLAWTFKVYSNKVYATPVCSHFSEDYGHTFVQTELW